MSHNWILQCLMFTWLMSDCLLQDYSVPDISLFPEENAEGKKVIFRDTSEDARIFGFPIKANSIIINAGLWVLNHFPRLFVQMNHVWWIF